ncbi:unnamed protein product [Caenorhabditis angaria]|uniref:Phospholipase B1, membrane-associated n=1 Tax=Caenorhabditis angaria TaxID=860376 RepID=A0A9P1N6C1_9PELO|nr:unnamed protein product [Caenorhabditis angaria]
MKKPLLFLFLILLFILKIRSEDSDFNDNIRLEEKLTVDREFYDQWMQLISLQNEQLLEQQLDYPLDYVLTDLSTCPRHQVTAAEDADSLRAEHLQIYAEIGQLSSYCPSNYTLLKKGVLGSCRQRSSSMTLPSIQKMLQLRGANLTTIESNSLLDSLAEQAKDIAQTIKNIPGQENVWKMIMILATIQDGTASETGQTAVEVLAAIEELETLLPSKTFVVVLRTSGSGIWRDASHQSQACHEQLAKWKVHNKFNYNSVWDQVEKIVDKNYKKTTFNVEVLPLFKDPALTNLPEEMDLSVLGYDCAHFSERGLSLLHLAIWNSLITRKNARISQFRPNASPVLCPDPSCPFFRTAKNTDMCIWVPQIEFTIPPIASRLIVIAVLILTVILASIILLFVCHSRRIANEKRGLPRKAFGASFSSIKFIDEDVV